jgi:hypothetical protein
VAAVLAYFFTLWVTLSGRVSGNRRPGLDLRAFAIPGHHSAYVPCVV